MDTKKEEVLRQLKLVRKAKNLSYQDIVDGTEEMGMAVSMSSVKRVFAEDSRACDFRYSTTLRPIVRFVMGIDGDAEEPKTFEEAKVSADGLAAVVDYKDALITKMEQELAHLKGDLDAAQSSAKSAETSSSRWRAAAFLILTVFALSQMAVIAILVTGL